MLLKYGQENGFVYFNVYKVNVVCIDCYIGMMMIWLFSLVDDFIDNILNYSYEVFEIGGSEICFDNINLYIYICIC